VRGAWISACWLSLLPLRIELALLMLGDLARGLGRSTVGLVLEAAQLKSVEIQQPCR
jgi:hypothetical protein